MPATATVSQGSSESGALVGSGSVSVCPNPTFKSEFQIKCKLSQFTKVTEEVNGAIVELYKSPEFLADGILWSFEIRPNLYKKRAGQTNLSGAEAEYIRMTCTLFAKPKDPIKGPECVGLVWVTVSTSYYHKMVFANGSSNKRSILPGEYCRIEFAPGIHTEEVMSWFEEEILFPDDPNYAGYNDGLELDGYVCVTVTVLDDLDLVDDMQGFQGKYFKLQQELLTQMKDEAKVVDLFLKLSYIDAESGSGTADGNPPEDFWIVSNSGSVTGFHKVVLKVRGGEHLKGCINSGMTESLTSQLKWDTYDHDLIVGFKAYLYEGTLPNLKSMADEYFKLGDYSHLDQIKELAELELCKKIRSDEFIEKAYVLARNYKTKYLKDEIKKLMKSDPRMLERIIDDNFDALGDLIKISNK